MTWIIEEKHKLPIDLPDKEEMTKEEFLKFCAANSHLRIERDENNQILIMPPVGGETGNKHVQIAFELEFWNRQTKLGRTFDSSTGFELPDGSMRTPDVCWIGNSRWNKITLKERTAFLPFAPDFVVELSSPSDNLSDSQKKMKKWIQNGTQLAWLIVSKNQTTFVYRSDETIDKIAGFDKKLSGEKVLPGFEFDLSVLF